MGGTIKLDNDFFAAPEEQPEDKPEVRTQTFGGGGIVPEFEATVDEIQLDENLNAVKQGALDTLEYISEPPATHSEEAAQLLENDMLDPLGEVGIGDGISYAQAAGTIFPAFSQAWAESKSNWSKTFLSLSVGDQVAARSLVDALENINVMSTEEAKHMLTRSVLHPSDVMQYYWKTDKDDSGWEQGANMLSGFLMDVFMDPLTYLGPLMPLAVATKVGQRVINVAGTAYDLGKIKQAERRQLLFIDEMRGVITEDTVFKKGGSANMDQQIRNLHQLEQAGAGRITFAELENGLKLTDTGKEKLLRQKAMMHEKKGWLKEVSDGERKFHLGVRVPFTNLGMEFATAPLEKLPLIGAKGRLSIANSDSLSGIKDFIGKHPIVLDDKSFVGQSARLTADIVNNIWTKTGFPLFDDRLTLSYGDMDAFKFQTYNLDAQRREKLADMPDDLRSQIEKDILDELELGYSSKIDLLRRFNKKPYQKRSMVGQTEETQKAVKELQDFVTLIEPTQALRKLELSQKDMDRLERIDSNPVAREIVDDIRRENELMLDEYAKRGIPLKELNPFQSKQVRGYVKHMVTKEWLDIKAQERGLDLAAGEFVTSMSKRVDDSARQRKIDLTIREANAEGMEKLGFPIFIEDPLAAHSARMVEMRQIVNNWDMLEEATNVATKVSKGGHPGLGWVKLDTDDIIQKYTSLAKTFTDGRPEYTARKFFPKYYLDKKNDVYLPSAVHDRILQHISPRLTQGPLSPLFRGLSFMNKIFYNNALFGTGYLGLNMTSNMVQLASAGVNPLKIFGSIDLLLNPKTANSIRVLDPTTGLKKMVPAEEIFMEGVRRDLWGNGIANLEWIDLAENMGGTYHLINAEGANPLSRVIAAYARTIHTGTKEAAQAGGKSMGNLLTKKTLTAEGLKEAYTALDYASLWRVNRYISQHSDDMAKMTVFIDRLKKGYSYGAAAEAAENYFYNYRNLSSKMRKFNTVVPFSTFPMKTLELTMKEIAKGDLKKFTIPFKAKAHLEGAYVLDSAMRAQLEDQNLEYVKTMAHIHGPIFAGQREVVFEMPWAKASLNTWLNGNINVHPFVKAAGALIGVSTEVEEGGGVRGQELNDLPYDIRAVAESMIPPFWRMALGRYAIENKDMPFRDSFVGFYTPQPPTPKQRSNQDRTAMLYDNSVAFGAFLEKTRDDDFLYRLLFADEIPLTDDINDMPIKDRQRLARRGEFIRKHFRAITIGSARLTKLDTNYFVNRGAISRRIKRQTKQMERSIIKKLGGAEIDIDKLLGTVEDSGTENEDKFIKEFLKKHEDLAPQFEALRELQNKRFELDVYYDLVLKSQDKFPDSDIWSTIFGLDEYKHGFGVYGESQRDFLDLKRELSEEAEPMLVGPDTMPEDMSTVPVEMREKIEEQRLEADALGLQQLLFKQKRKKKK